MGEQTPAVAVASVAAAAAVAAAACVIAGRNIREYLAEEGSIEDAASKPAAPARPHAYTLENSVHVPLVGFGTAFFVDEVRRPELAYAAVATAIELGYRHIDTAMMYGCERQVGRVLGDYFQSGKLKREDIHITTKIAHPPASNYPTAKTQYMYDPKLSAYSGVLQEYYQSLENLGVGYVDLLLIHWPGVMRDGPVFPVPTAEAARTKRLEMWRALEYLYDKKLVRAIGVSNFTEEHLEQLLPCCAIPPMMNQIEVHPYLSQQSLVVYCQRRGIAITAYSPLASGGFKLIEHPTIVKIAESHGSSPAAVIFAWLLQRGIIIIPKSSSPERLKENLRAGSIKLTSDEMRLISALNCDRRSCPDPNLII